MSAKAINPTEGKIVVVDIDRIKVSDHYIGTRDIPKDVKSRLKIGVEVVVRFPDNNGYYAKEIEIKDGSEEVKAEKTDFEELIREMEPHIPQGVIDRLSEADKQDILDLMKSCLSEAVKLYDISATFDDTKKEISEIISSIMPVALTLAIIIDANTKQILKKNLPDKK
jgi:hypothetical protein